jgi:hypothetical protein
MENITEKMSKSNDNKPNLSDDLSAETKIAALESELKYWKQKYELLEKYGKPESEDPMRKASLP